MRAALIPNGSGLQCFASREELLKTMKHYQLKLRIALIL